jgi:hypothetical protein
MNKVLDFASPKRLAWVCLLFTFFSLPSISVAGFNAKPVVDAGSNQTVYAGDLVNLTATATDPEGATLRYLWSYKARNLINLSIAQPTHLATSFIAPDTNKTIKIRLIFSAIDPQNAKAADHVFITIKPKPAPPPVVPSGQDGNYGRDLAADLTDGSKGFSFIKLDAAGAALAHSANQWTCVKDQVTGLVWELKTDDGGLHDKDDSFVWYESDPRLGNGGLPGYEKATDYDPSRSDQTCSGFTSANNASYCNTKAFVNRVNQSGYCGANNWRLPTREELNSIVDYQNSPRIDTVYFPLIQSNYYWTSVPYAYLNKQVWTINFQYGGGSPWEKHYNYPVRLVHN